MKWQHATLGLVWLLVIWWVLGGLLAGTQPKNVHTWDD